MVESIDTRTSYVPTAVCAKAGTTDRLFVAGWAERDGVLVIEEWTLEGHLVGSSATTGGGTATSFAPPTARRQTRLHSAAGEYAPITDLVVLPVDGRLLALTRTPAGDPQLVFVDVDAERLEPAPFAAHDVADIDIAYHTTAGVLLTLHQSAPWAMFAPDADTVHVHRDADVDGTFDTFETLSYEDFYAVYPVSGFDARYTF